MVIQCIKPQTVLRKLEKYKIPQATLAAIMARSDGLISQWLRGDRGLSYAMQRQVCQALEFFDETVERSAVPVDFRQADRIVALWREHKARLDENAVIRLAHELEEDADRIET